MFPSSSKHWTMIIGKKGGKGEGRVGGGWLELVYGGGWVW